MAKKKTRRKATKTGRKRSKPKKRVAGRKRAKGAVKRRKPAKRVAGRKTRKRKTAAAPRKRKRKYSGMSGTTGGAWSDAHRQITR